MVASLDGSAAALKQQMLWAKTRSKRSDGFVCTPPKGKATCYLSPQLGAHATLTAAMNEGKAVLSIGVFVIKKIKNESHFDHLCCLLSDSFSLTQVKSGPE